MQLVRLALFASVMAALCVASLAQETPPIEEPPPPALNSKTYDFTGLVDDNKIAKLPDRLAPDCVFPDLEQPGDELSWSVRNYRGGARCFNNADEAMQAVLMFCTTGEPGNTHGDATGGQSITLTCDDELHRRVAWTLEALKAASAIRVKLRAYSLPPGTSAACANAAEADKLAQGGMLLGAVSGQLGETLLVQQLKPWEFIQGYEVLPEGKCSVVRASLDAGRELVAGALLLPDGRVWLQGWCSRLEITETREVRSSCGKIECPRVKYSHAPLSALIENNGAALIDEGAHGRTLLVCSVEGTLPNRALDCGTRTTLGLVNVTSTLQGALPGLPWLVGANRGATKLGRSADPAEAWAQPCVLHAATNAMANQLAYESQVLGAIVALGPYLGVRITEAGGDSESSPEEFEATRKQLSETLKAINAGRKPIELRAQAWRVKKVPAAIAQGNATPKDLQELGAAAFERILQGLPGQVLGLADLELAALITGDGPAPELGVAAWGAQLQWLARESAGGTAIELRLGLVDGERKLKSVEESGMVKFERATRAPVQAELNGTLAANSVLCSVVPDGEGYLVVAVQRVR